MDYDNQYRNNQHLSKYRNIKEGTNFLTSPCHHKNSRSTVLPCLQPEERRYRILKKTIVWRQQSKETRKENCGRCAYLYDKTI
jgi:hypothetical protein